MMVCAAVSVVNVLNVAGNFNANQKMRIYRECQNMWNFIQYNYIMHDKI